MLRGHVEQCRGVHNHRSISTKVKRLCSFLHPCWQTSGVRNRSIIGARSEHRCDVIPHLEGRADSHGHDVTAASVSTGSSHAAKAPSTTAVTTTAQPARAAASLVRRQPRLLGGGLRLWRLGWRDVWRRPGILRHELDFRHQQTAAQLPEGLLGWIPCLPSAAAITEPARAPTAATTTTITSCTALSVRKMHRQRWI